ncbi:MAG: fused response regulator/phosphatase [Chitinivorax sp.]
MKILIVDDAEIMLLLIQKFVSSLGHQAVTASNGQMAVEAYRAERPDLVLMDMMMPVMDGPEAAMRIKAIAGDRWVPIVFVTGIGEENRLAEAIEQGADDYLLKPINFRILEAKIKAIQRNSDLQQKVREQSAVLAEYYERAEEEKRVARHLMEQMVNADRLADPQLEYWIDPAESLSGDLIASARTPGQVLYVMLADGIGHGLTAALNVLPLTQPFYTMTEKGFTLPEILVEMNRKVRQVLPIGRFVSTAIVAIDSVGGTLEIWNGGMPEILLLNRAGDKVAGWKSTHLPIGILSPEKFTVTCEHYEFAPGDRLFLCSDGLLESHLADGEQFGIERALAALQSRADAPGRIEGLKHALTDFMQGASHHDDVSVVLVDCSATSDAASEFVPSERLGIDYDSHLHVCWRFQLVLGPDELRNCSVVPFVMEFVKQVEALRSCQSEVFLILSELFNNALDHGVLEIASALKDVRVGMDEYLRQRFERLENLAGGEVEIGLELVEAPTGRVLRIKVRDSGRGFDYTSRLVAADDDSQTHGRGIRLLRNLATSIQYLGNGNEVVLYYLPKSAGTTA